MVQNKEVITLGGMGIMVWTRILKKIPITSVVKRIVNEVCAL